MKEMNASTGMSDDAVGHEPHSGPGRRLRQAREAAGLSVDYVAAELHLAPPTILALERGAYESLPAPVFVSGYLRNYARLLRLDPEPVVKAYQAEDAAGPAATARPAPDKANRGRAGGWPLALVSLAVVLVLAGLVALWWQNEPDPLAVFERTDTREPAAPADQDAPEIAEQPAANPDMSTSAAGADTPAPPSQPGRTSPSEPLQSGAATAPETQAPAAPPAPEPVPSAAQPAPEGAAPEEAAATTAAEEEGIGEAAAPPDEPPEVVLTFDGPCWVDIRDATREFKLFGEMGEGDRRVLAGTPPYSVIIGNAAATTITIDGQAFDLSRYARGNVARFTLDPAAALTHSSEQPEPNEQ